jgi:hypothetical protein
MEIIATKGNFEKTTFHDIGETYKELIIFRDNSVGIRKYRNAKIKLSQEDERFINDVLNISN